MKKILLGFVLIVAFMIAPTVQAATVDMAAVMLRMQAIITQMQELQKEFAGLQSQVVVSSPTTTAGSTSSIGSVLGAAAANLQEVVVSGATNDTIKKVQQLLATDVTIYPYGAATGFFGPKTEEAIKNLQARFDMKQVGVVGPETAALLMSYFTAYPSGSYPADVLKTRPVAPAVLGAIATTVTTSVTTPITSGSNPLEAIYLKKDDGEVVVRVVFKNGNAVGTVAESSSESDIVKAITRKTGISSSVVTAVLDMTQLKPSSRYDESDAEDMLDDAERAIDDAIDAIEEADDDGDDVSDAEDLLEEAEDALDEAWDAFDDEDYDETYKMAKEARDLANDAEDEL